MGTLLIEKLHPDAKEPTVAHPGSDLGYDVYALEDTFLQPYKPAVVKTGIAAMYEENPEQVYLGGFSSRTRRPIYGLEVKDRSSMALKNGVHTMAGVIDHGYTGEIGIVMVLLGPSTHMHPLLEDAVRSEAAFARKHGHYGSLMSEEEVYAARLKYYIAQSGNESGRAGYAIKAGDKIAQLVPREVKTTDKIVVVAKLPKSDRGAAGYGSTGR